MKKLFKLLLPVAVTALLFAGCGVDSKKGYNFYTNIPDGQYSLLDGSFKVGEKISGYAGQSQSGEVAAPTEFTAPTGFTTKSQYYYYMFADAQLIVSADLSAEGAVDKYNEFTKDVGATLDSINKALSATVPKSDVNNFNRYDAGVQFEISKITYEVLSVALDVYTFTDGYYNPALYYNIQAYGFGGSYDFPESASQMPDDKLLATYTDLARHFGDIQLKEEDGKYFVTKPDYTVEVEGKTLSMKLDLGGIGKGYAVDCIDKLFDNYGYEYGLFNFGSSSMVIKSNIKEGNYLIEFVNPRSVRRDGYIRIPARNEMVSTSGDDTQYFELDGVRYCHVFDPTTGKPVQTGIMSVTIVGGRAAEDDALTTAIMSMGKERAIAFIQEKLTDRKVVFTCE